jgi:hypothetical protein
MFRYALSHRRAREGANVRAQEWRASASCDNMGCVVEEITPAKVIDAHCLLSQDYDSWAKTWPEARKQATCTVIFMLRAAQSFSTFEIL